jgi:RNA polymerase sigma-70 factor (ECF subfamily)
VEGRPLDENELVSRAKQQDVNAYEALVHRYQELAFRAAYHVTLDAAEAEDAAQEAFVKAYYALSRFREGAPFKPWLLTIVVNEARNRRKAAGRRAGIEQRAFAVHASGDPARSPEAVAEAGELRAALLGAIRRLREEDRLVLAYRYFLDLSEAEMAQALHCARGTIKSRLSRALTRLRAVIKLEPESRAIVGELNG